MVFDRGTQISHETVALVEGYARLIIATKIRLERKFQKSAYPCFPNVPPPPALFEKTILAYIKKDVYGDDVVEVES